MHFDLHTIGVAMSTWATNNRELLSDKPYYNITTFKNIEQQQQIGLNFTEISK